jgi:hypothetical protein
MSRSRQLCATFLGLWISVAAASGQNSISSISGQFAVSISADFSPLAHDRAIATNTDFVRLEPTLLAVAAERFKNLLGRDLGLKSGDAWSGKIFLALHPARSLDDSVTVVAEPFLQTWNYRVELPDVIRRDRFVRALSAVILLELANRNTPVSARSAEIPAWLADGFAQRILAIDGEKIFLTTAGKKVDGLAQNRVSELRRGFDPLASVRYTLQNSPAATFDQLSWPGDSQLNGYDGGVYRGSAQLFVTELLGLKNGATKMQSFLADLHTRLNWQSAFFNEFNEDFKRPLDVEKWWALRVIRFAASAPGPRWSALASRNQLAGLLVVPVEVRTGSNALPAHAEISLQAAIRSFDAAQQSAVLRPKLRDLALVQMRLAPPFAALAEAYQTVLSDFLEELDKGSSFFRHAAFWRRKGGLEDTLRKLDALDVRRRAAEAAIKPAPFRP